MSPQTLPADDRVRAALHPLAGVDLDELVGTAALLTRVDRKYVLPVDDAVAVLDALARTTAARVLEIDGTRSAAYESVYFDTPDLASFRLTATRRRRRFKVRTRTYLDSGTSFLEVKTRAARGTTFKQRVAHDCPTALDGGREFVHRTLAAEGIDGVPEHALAPGLVSRYRRTTLLLHRPD
ncbi:MAG: VTC domain-containing protein, partial [Cellulosimicrobium funkei]